MSWADKKREGKGHHGNQYKAGKMLSKDCLRNEHSRLVQTSTQPNILSDSSQKQVCKETAYKNSQYKL